LDRTLIQLAEGALEDAHPVRLELPVRNVNRTVGTLLGSEVTRRYGAQGLPDDTIHVTLIGSAGQSIGAFLPPGITLELIGDANDYVGKGLSGGRVIVRPPDDVLFLPEDNVIAGNTLLFGATSGEVYLRGRVGERFAARNSGALTVVEGVGDHACEYMTAGRVVVLGKTGRNMAAGMSGGIAFVLGLDPAMVNPEMVELQRLEPEDLTWLRDVIAKHAAYTGSTVATSVLSDWPRRSAQFTKVMPTDYQRVLQATRMAKAEGRDVDTAIMEASRG
jgi:glutamate synthase domain-containing protein 3